MNLDAHRIAPKLWVGSRPGPEVCRVFDVVVLAAMEYQPKLPCAIVLRAPIDDDQLTLQEAQKVIDAARKVNELRRCGKRVLVTCNMGVNRSALVAALALMLLGASAEEAIAQVRSNRKPPSGMMPLSNEHFVAALRRAEQRLRRVA